MTERCVILPALHGTNLESKSQDKRSTGKGGGGGEKTGQVYIYILEHICIPYL